jgi:hypothetical protein
MEFRKLRQLGINQIIYWHMLKVWPIPHDIDPEAGLPVRFPSLTHSSAAAALSITPDIR